MVRRPARSEVSRRHLGRPRGDGRLRGRALGPGEAAAAAGPVGRDVPARVARLSDPGGLEGGEDRRGGGEAAPSSISVRDGATGRTRASSAPGRRTSPDSTGTSLVEAPIRLGIPCVGTMAHSWVQAFARRADRLRGVLAHLPRRHDPARRHLRHVSRASRRAAAVEPPVAAIRIDSGDLDRQSREARAILDVRRQGHDPDRCERRPRRVSDSRPGRCGRADRRIRGRHGTRHEPGRPGALDGLQARRDRRQGAGEAQPRQEDVPARQAGLPPGRRAGEAARRSCGRGGRSRRRASLAGRRSSGTAGFLARLPSLDAIRARCRSQLAALPDGLGGTGADASYPVSYSEKLQRAAAALGP